VSTEDPAGSAREATAADRERFRAGLGAALAVLGHELAWAEGHGTGYLADYPGHTGTCARCGGVVRAVLPVPGGDVVTYEGPIVGPLTGGPLTCEAARNHRTEQQ
jgi:hypothetical protein